MTQQRFIDFGTTVEASKFKDAWKEMFAPTIFVGYDASILASMIPNATVEFSPGSLIVPNGTIITDDVAIPIEVPLGAPAFDSTIVYTHVDQKILGGAAASLDLITGTHATWPDSTVMAWISYPGSSVPLDPSHITPAPKAQINPLALPTSAEVDTLLPPFSEFFTISTGANITAGTVYDAGLERLFYEVSSTVFAAGVESAVVIFQQTANRPTAPAEVSVGFDGPATDSLTIEVFDTLGVAVTGSPLVVAGTGALATVELPITDGDFTEGDLYVVKLTIGVDIASIAQLTRIDINYRQLPF